MMTTRLMLACGCAVLLVRCTARHAATTPQLAFLTGDGCPNSTIMRRNLDKALQAVGLSTDYQLIDVDALPKNDPRGSYGTPTVLISDKDLFGMQTPIIQEDAATCRLYPGGVPSTDHIATELQKRN